LDSTPPPVAPVPAAVDVVFFRENRRRTRPNTGTVVNLANHGVPQTLRISRSGSSAFVTA